MWKLTTGAIFYRTVDHFLVSCLMYCEMIFSILRSLGLFMGFSMLSLFEIIYFLLLRSSSQEKGKKNDDTQVDQEEIEHTN